mgnify:CR=1 FL=1|jgi:CHAD domain-containing protein
MNRQSPVKKTPAEHPVRKSISPAVRRLSLKDPLSIAGGKLCRTYVNVLQVNTPGAVKGKDAEFVHRMRVAVRKLRFILRLWNPYLDTTISDRLREELRWLAGALGEVRDADVMAQRFETQLADSFFSKPFKDFIAEKLSQKEVAARETLIAAITSDRYKQLLSSLTRLFDHASLQGKNPPLREQLPGFFSFAIKKAGRYSGKKNDEKHLHPLRIAIKRLRYLTEFFGDCYQGKLKDHQRRLKKYQEILGAYCDAKVAELFLSSLTAAKGTVCSPDAARRCLELGGLIHVQRLDAEQQYRRFRKKAAALSQRLELVRRQTKLLPVKTG